MPQVQQPAIIGTDIRKAKEWLEKNEVVAIPTETVYGLAGNAFQPQAVARIFEVKNRPSFDPLIVHTDSLEKVMQFVTYLPDKAQQLANAFWPGPLTLLLPKKDLIPDLVTSGLDTVGVRIPSHPLALSLLASLDFPLAAPSANPFGYVSPTTAEHVRSQLELHIPYILDGGPSQVGIESTIAGFDGDRVIIYRLGGTSVEEMERAVGSLIVKTSSSSNPKAPGMLISHYAPRKPVFTEGLEQLLGKYPPEEIGLLAFCEGHPAIPVRNQVILSAKASLTEAAQHLFAGLRSLDASPVSVIFAELLPEKGLGRAINDRLRRAAAK